LGFALTCQIDDALRGSYLDKRPMRQVLLNLLANARKFTRRAAACRDHRELRGQRDHHRHRRYRHPSGERFARLAIPFEQVGERADPRQEGSGLGLAITKTWSNSTAESFALRAASRRHHVTVSLAVTSARECGQGERGKPKAP